MVTSIEDQHALVALERFAAQVTIPILYDDPKAVDQIGTGTLLTVQGRYFLVTAAHLFDEGRDPGRFAIPKGRKNADVHTLGPYQLYKAKEPEIDIAILELHESTTIEAAKTGWRILTLENIGKPSAAGVFILCGYPSERAWRTENLIGGKPITVFTERIPQPANATPPVHPALDLFFHYSTDAPNIEGETVTTPHLRGASGASVWEYRDPPLGSLWAPEQALRVVGVQSAFLHEQYFRAKSWDMVLQMMRQADSTLEAEIDCHLRNVRPLNEG